MCMEMYGDVLKVTSNHLYQCNLYDHALHTDVRILWTEREQLFCMFRNSFDNCFVSKWIEKKLIPLIVWVLLMVDIWYWDLKPSRSRWWWLDGTFTNARVVVYISWQLVLKSLYLLLHQVFCGCNIMHERILSIGIVGCWIHFMYKLMLFPAIMVFTLNPESKVKSYVHALNYFPVNHSSH